MEFIALILYPIIIVAICVIMYTKSGKKEKYSVHYKPQEIRESWIKLYFSYSQIVELINIIWEFHNHPPENYEIPEGTHEELYKLLVNAAVSLEAKAHEE